MGGAIQERRDVAVGWKQKSPAGGRDDFLSGISTALAVRWRGLGGWSTATWSLRNIGGETIRHVPDTGGTADNVPGTGSLAVVTGFESGEGVGSVRRS
ncbi:MAG: hypothetical protein IK135_02425 [Bacteroidales bacterium]|nr:hypothetical protein [Bacteroidales bacterium]